LASNAVSLLQPTLPKSKRFQFQLDLIVDRQLSLKKYIVKLKIIWYG